MHALILVDLQNDFVEGGALPVPRGKELVPLANALQSTFDFIVATQDWHPRNHKSFAINHPGKQPGDLITLDGQPQVLWPVHCVQNTHGADFIPGLNRTGWQTVFQKGIDPEIDSYSAFFDNGKRRSTGLSDYLKQHAVDTVYILGLAIEYCVKFTALDSVSEGFRTLVIEDACRGIESRAGDTTRAVTEMQNAGIEIIRSNQVSALNKSKR